MVRKNGTVPAAQILPYRFRVLLSMMALTRLISYLRAVETSCLKLRNLIIWTSADKYG
ncbi:hypothetical protein HRbin13_01317 [bacterium HR13]|nr:hypothetical protein HRbin13_01317 [bacterium HR13]